MYVFFIIILDYHQIYFALIETDISKHKLKSIIKKLLEQTTIPTTYNILRYGYDGVYFKLRHLMFASISISLFLFVKLSISANII